MIGSFDSSFHNKRVERWDPTTGHRTILFALPDGGSLGGQLTRPDGTAVLVPGPQSGASSWEVHDLMTGNVTTIQPASEVFLATVMLR